LKLFLVVYVDDFKLSGPKGSLDEGWDLIRQGIKTDVPHDVGLYLGCIHRVAEKVLPDTGAKVRVMEYDMEEFPVSCVERYKELTGVSTFKRVATPFIHEPTEPEFRGLKGMGVSSRGPSGESKGAGGDEDRGTVCGQDSHEDLVRSTDGQVRSPPGHMRFGAVRHQMG